MSRVILRHGKKDQVQSYYLLCLQQRVSALLICIMVVLDYGFVHFYFLQHINKSSHISGQLPVLRRWRERVTVGATMPMLP